MLGPERGRLAVSLDMLTDALILIGQHGGQMFVMPRHGGGSDVMVLMQILVEAPAAP